MQHIAPSIPALRPQQNWSVPQALVASSLVAMSSHLQSILQKMSPLPIEHAPRHLSRVISLFQGNALCAIYRR